MYVPSDLELKEGFRTALQYEIEMLTFTYCQLVCGQAPKQMNNALIESFAIHARNVYDFLASRDCKDDLLAAHYSDGYVFQPTDRIRSLVEVEINKQISHLTFTRVGATKIGDQERHELFAALMAEVHKFASWCP